MADEDFKMQMAGLSKGDFDPELQREVANMNDIASGIDTTQDGSSVYETNIYLKDFKQEIEYDEAWRDKMID